MIIGGSGSGKTNVFFNLIKEQGDIDKIYLYAKELSEPKNEFLIKKHEDVGKKHLNDEKHLLCSNTMDYVYENTDDYNPNRKRRILFVFDDIIVDIISNKKLQTVVKEFFIRCRELNISFVFITQSYFSVLKDVRLNSTRYLIMKINNRRKLQDIAIDHSADKDFMNKMYKRTIFF